MRKKIVKGLIMVGLVFAIYMIGLALIYDSPIWMQYLAYILGVVMAFACGMIIEEV